jgi:hypothetical protein
MSKENNKENKVVKINENKLVDLIDKIVQEAVAEEKKVWIAENTNEEKSLLESRIEKLENLLGKATITKKAVK